MTTATAQTTIPVFKTETGRQAFLNAYDELMKLWPVPYETIELKTDFGSCHIIASGPIDGEPVLLFHGMTGNSAFWYANMDALKHCRTYCIDAPGDFGMSTVTRPIKTPDEAAQWIDQLLDGLKLEKASLLGHSMGGWFASNYALTHPERVQRLVLIAPVATILPPPFLKLLKHIYPAMLFPSPKRIKKGWDWFCAEGYTLPPAVMNTVIAAYTYGKSRLPVIPGVFPKEAWTKLTAPVLFLVGDEEKIYEANQAIAKVSETIPHAECHMIPRAGHCLTVEQREPVNELIEQFLTAQK